MKVKSFNLDDDVADFVSSRGNQSEFVNRLLRNVMNGYDPESVIIDYRIQEEKARKTRVMHQAEAIDETIQELESRKERLHEVEELKLSEIQERLRKIPEDRRGSSNPAVQKRAEELDMSPSELLEELDL